MFKKIYIIVSNFFRSTKLNEKLEIFILPIVITAILYIFFNSKISDFKNFSADFNNNVIGIASLLAAFGIASISILITSSSPNIETAATHYTNRLDRNQKQVSYYKLQIYRSFFSLILQMLVLILAIVYKFICQSASTFLIGFFYIELCTLLIAIMCQVLSTIGMYFLFVTRKGS